MAEVNITYNPEVRISCSEYSLKVRINLLNGNITPIKIHLHQTDTQLEIDVPTKYEIPTLIIALEGLSEILTKEMRKSINKDKL